MEIKVTRDKLEQLNLFTGLSPEALSELAAQCRFVKLPKGEHLFNQGDRSTALYLIDTGRVRIDRRYEDGETLTLSLYGPGELVGELSAISNEPRAASALAEEETQLIALDHDMFFAYLGRYPSMAVEVMVRLTRRLRQMNLRLREIGASNPQSRIAGLLLFLAEEDNDFKTGLVTTRFSMRRIAQAASVDMEFLRTIIREWEDEGYIGLDGRRFLLHEPEALFEIAGW
jgi:CRP/FNR family transcriptional regulator, cyclic AMP receptor protein